MSARQDRQAALQGGASLGSGAMFDAIAGRYDAVNRVLSLGLDQGWRRAAVEALALPPRARVLDLATGTGDLALLIAARHPDAEVLGIDPSPGMLAVARRKIAAAGREAQIQLLQGDAERLELADASLAGVSIAFGIRNVPDRLRALAEMARVTRPGGRIVILELAEPRRGPLGIFARTYVRRVVPWIGARLSGAGAYRYLQRSIAAFPEASVFAERMRESGLRVREVRPLGFGACVLYVAEPDRGRS